ncbi:hypothetical protein [Nannocystis radixulma]|uniref:Uncharacterized protein n=1 Tax=Nannocystis radixulma TaxID=2995305 RepID=A0ABT5BPJ9_9BACT|nr:hypothetical protein [Nannocystis radixulma]MDC0676091.1 hypothetical protein [Nannocystis radixulma]
MPSARPGSALALAGLLACNEPNDNASGFTTPPVTTAPVSTTSGDASSGSSGSSSTTTSAGSSGDSDSSAAASSSTTMVWDMGPPPDFDTGPPIGCQGKIDFLFIISRHGFMKPHQDKLIAAFPQFIETIQGQFSDFDVQILVTDTEPEWGSPACDDDCPDPCVEAPDYPCDYWPTTCDTTMGAGVVMNVGQYTTNTPCLDGPRRYITADTPDISATFECLARVGTVGYNQIGNALVAAMSPKLNKVGGCNEGFVRDDALLMVTVIGPGDTTGLPGGSTGTWQEWMQAVVGRKSGDLDAIVMLALTDDCTGLTDPDYRLCRMVPEFPHSMLELLTSPDYGSIFKDAAALAIETCNSFVPG